MQSASKPNPNSRLILVAAAGSGKTRHLVKKALVCKGNVLITTFTEANEDEIRQRIIDENKFIPTNICVQTWWSFLLQHFVRPFQGSMWDKDIFGLILVNGISAPYTKESDISKYYFSPDGKIYSDKISKFALNCNEKTDGMVIDRIERIFQNIFVDETQDLSGHDLDILKILLRSNINTTLVCDPRQGVFSTVNSRKNLRYRKSKILDFFKENNFEDYIDQDSLTINYRCNEIICDFSNHIFPDFRKTISANFENTGHDGVFLVRKKDVEEYLNSYKPVQLRYNRRTIVNENYPVMNFRESKGLSFDRVLIYPTSAISTWLTNRNQILEDSTSSIFYVAATRARYSVAFLYDYQDNEIIQGAIKFK